MERGNFQNKYPKFETKSSVKLDYRDNIALAEIFRARKATLLGRIENRAKNVHLHHRKNYKESEPDHEGEEFFFSKKQKKGKNKSNKRNEFLKI